MYVFYATLLESCGAVLEARDVFFNLISQQQQRAPVPDSPAAARGVSLEVVFRAADLERRALQSEPEKQFTAVTALLDIALSSSTCRLYCNTVICRKGNFVAHCSAARGGVAAGIMTILRRGERIDSSGGGDGEEEKSASDLAPHTGDSFASIPTSLLAKVFQYDVDLSLVKTVFELLLLCQAGPLRDKKVCFMLYVFNFVLDDKSSIRIIRCGLCCLMHSEQLHMVVLTSRPSAIQLLHAR
jgi:hypothetical protein